MLFNESPKEEQIRETRATATTIAAIDPWFLQKHDFRKQKNKNEKNLGKINKKQKLPNQNVKFNFSQQEKTKINNFGGVKLNLS